MSRFGPGLLVTAAFIGPGTIATASASGANFGFALLWALLFSVIATLVLQEMAARLGIVTGAGLSEALRSSVRNPMLRRAAIVLVVGAIGLGNAAYEAGNIAGAALGLESLSTIAGSWWALLVGLVAAFLLFSGSYAMIEKALIFLVLLMSTVFLLTMFMVKPDLGEMLQGLTTPSIPDGATLTIIALIGTTVVPYNLFLHAKVASEKWADNPDTAQALRESRWDTGLSITLGGLITLAVMSTSAAAFFGQNATISAANMATQLEPLLGPAARYFFAGGLLAAGLTSAVTAPLAASYAVCGALGWPTTLRDRGFVLIGAAVLVTGTLFAAVGTKPLVAIIFAQAANGFLLPIIAIFLLWLMNQRDLLGESRNGLAANVLGIAVVAVAAGLGLYKIAKVTGLIA